jgi:hypothetical protein
MIPTGDPNLDEPLDGGYQQGALHIVAGGPASGKTTWLRRTIRLALNAGKTVHVVDLERTIQRHFPGEARISFETDLTRPFPEAVDLLIIDCAHQQPIPLENPELVTVGLMALWLGSNLVPRLQRLEHPVKLMSWQSRANHVLGGPDSLMPKALLHAADVVLYLDREQGQTNDGGFRAVLRKNRFGTAGGTWGYTLPEANPIVRPTVWERLEET